MMRMPFRPPPLLLALLAVSLLVPALPAGDFWESLDEGHQYRLLDTNTDYPDTRRDHIRGLVRSQRQEALVEERFARNDHARALAEEYLEERFGASGRAYRIVDVVGFYALVEVRVEVGPAPDASLWGRLTRLEDKAHAFVLGHDVGSDELYMRHPPSKLPDRRGKFLALFRGQD